MIPIGSWSSIERPAARGRWAAAQAPARRCSSGSGHIKMKTIYAINTTYTIHHDDEGEREHEHAEDDKGVTRGVFGTAMSVRGPHLVVRFLMLPTIAEYVCQTTVVSCVIGVTASRLPRSDEGFAPTEVLVLLDEGGCIRPGVALGLRNVIKAGYVDSLDDNVFVEESLQLLGIQPIDWVFIRECVPCLRAVAHEG